MAASREVCGGCQEEIWPEDEEFFVPGLSQDGIRYCSVCWDERVCHRCLHYESGQNASYYGCERCGRRIHLECCTAIAWCQCMDVICRDCVRKGDSCCARCECELDPDSDTFPRTADYDPGLLCDDCAASPGSASHETSHEET